MINLVLLIVGVGLIVWGAETFAENLAAASQRLGVTTFALAVLLAGAEPEELATAVAAGVRHVPAVAFGDVIGANVAICLVAIPVAAWIAPLRFSGRVLLYFYLAIPVGAVAAWFAWDGSVNRVQGAILVAGYVAYVGTIWWRERRPPALGEVGEIEEHADDAGRVDGGRVGRELLLVLVGTAAIVVGASVLVEAVRRFTNIEQTQTRLSLTVIGFATAFELVVLAWSTARRGMTDTIIAAVAGSFAYNATMTLGAAALITPLHISDARLLEAPLGVMVFAPVLVLALAFRRMNKTNQLGRVEAVGLVAVYVAFVVVVFRS